MSKPAKVHSETKRNDAPAFDFFPERFWFAVEGWSDGEIVRYFRLLGQQWMRDGLPESLKELKGLARGHVSERVLEKFPLSADGKRRNLFMEQIRGEQRDRIDARRLGAAIANLKKHGPDSLSGEDVERLLIAGYLVRESSGALRAIDKPAAERHAKRAIEVSLSDTLSERSAEPQRSADESPPPTTHHSPLITSPSPAREEGGVDWIDLSRRERLDWLERIAAAYGKRGKPQDVLGHIRDSIEVNNVDPAELLRCTEQATATIRQHAPQGFDSARVPHAETFFAKEQWRNPTAFAGYWDTSRSGSAPAARTAREASAAMADGSSSHSLDASSLFREPPPLRP